MSNVSFVGDYHPQNQALSSTTSQSQIISVDASSQTDVIEHPPEDLQATQRVSDNLTSILLKKDEEIANHVEQLQICKNKIIDLQKIIHDLHTKIQNSEKSTPYLIDEEKLQQQFKQLKVLHEGFIEEMKTSYKSSMPSPSSTSTVTNTKIPSYASIVQTKQPSGEFPTIVITPIRENITSQDIQQQLNTLQIDHNMVLRCITTPKGNLLLKCKTHQDMTNLSEELKKIATFTENVEISIKDPKGQKIIIFSIPKETDQSELESIIKRQYPHLTILKFIKSIQKTTSYHQVVEVDNQTYQQLIDRGRINIRFNSCRIRKHITVPRCYYCQRLHHIASNCQKIAQKTKTNHEVCCAFCSGHHATDTCKQKENIKKHKCINCTRSNRQDATKFDTNHAASSSSCPYYLEVLKGERAQQTTSPATNIRSE